ncbi:MAG: type II secretion system protein GspG [Gemmataceae bacterium]
MIVRKVDRRPSDRLGFTLMEVLVVVAILVILAGTASVFVFRYLETAKQDRVKADVRALTTACQAYKLKYDGYPESLQQLMQPPDGSRPFMESAANLVDPWGNPYQYNAQGTNNQGLKPDIWAIDPDGNTIGNWMR